MTGAYSGSGADADNHANQLNPEHDAYWSSRQSSDDDDDGDESTAPASRVEAARRDLARLVEKQQTTVLRPALEAELEVEIAKARHRLELLEVEGSTQAPSA